MTETLNGIPGLSAVRYLPTGDTSSNMSEREALSIAAVLSCGQEWPPTAGLRARVVPVHHRAHPDVHGVHIAWLHMGRVIAQEVAISLPAV